MVDENSRLHILEGCHEVEFCDFCTTARAVFASGQLPVNIGSGCNFIEICAAVTLSNIFY